MAEYTVKDVETGRTIKFQWNDPNPPTDADMETIFAEAKSTQQQPVKQQPTLSNDLITKVLRPLLEYGGMTAGGVVGATGGPVGSLAGAGLGYGGGKGVANLIEQLAGLRQPTTLPEKLAETGKDVLGGAAMEAGGGIVGKGISSAAKAVAESGLPQRLYGSAFKLPLSKKWTKGMGPEEISERTKTIGAGLKEEIPFSQTGYNNLKQLETETHQLVDELIKTEGKGTTVVTEDLINKGLQSAYKRAGNSSDPEGAKKIVDEIAQKFRAHGEQVPATKLQEIKKQLYDEVKWGGSEQTALVSQLNEIGKKGLAHEAMLELEKVHPEIARLNKNDASYIALKEAMEHALARWQNRDVTGLTSIIMATRNIPLGVVNWTIGHPYVKSKLAIALSKAGSITGQSVIKPLQYSIGSQFTEEPKWQTPGLEDYLMTGGQ